MDDYDWNTFYPTPQGYWDASTNEYMRLQGFYPCPLYARSSNMPAHGYDQQYTPPIGAWQPHMGMSAQLPQVNDSNAQQHYPAQYRLLVGNLPRNMASDAILRELRGTFCPIGECYVILKVQQRYPTAFIQYTTLEHAQQGLRLHGRGQVGDRVLRIEQVRGSGSSTPQSGQISGLALQQQPSPMNMDGGQGGPPSSFNNNSFSGFSTPQNGRNFGPTLQQQLSLAAMYGGQGGSHSSANNTSFPGSSTPQNWPRLGQAPQQQPDPTILNGILGGSPWRVSNNGLPGYSTPQNGQASGPAAQQHRCPMIMHSNQGISSSTAQNGATSGPAPQLHSCLTAVCPDQGGSSSSTQNNQVTEEETAKEEDKEDDKEKKEHDEEEEKDQKEDNKKEDHDDKDPGNEGQNTSDSNQQDENKEEKKKHEEGEQEKKGPDSTSNLPNTPATGSPHSRTRALFSRLIRLMAAEYRRRAIERGESLGYDNNIIEGALKELVSEEFEKENQVLVGA